MKIAIDYDNTMSADPRLFMIFAQAATVLGHEVAIVTSRHPSVPIPMDKCGIPVVYCAFKAKRGCYPADVWIDDDPKHIDQDHDLSLLAPQWRPCSCSTGDAPGLNHKVECARYQEAEYAQ